MRLPLWKKAALVVALLFSLWILTDDDTSGSKNYHHLAVMTALHRHRPSLRVYRSLLELNLLLWGSVISFYVWSKTIGTKMIGHLLFQPSDEVYKDGFSLLEKSLGRYQRVQTDDDDEFELAPRPESRQAGVPVEGGVEETKDGEDGPLGTDYSGELEMEGDEEGAPAESSLTGPPSVEAAAGLALDSLILVLISLFFFTFSSAEGGTYVDGMAKIDTLKFIALIAAPIFPLLLFVGGFAAAVFPWKKRSEFWKVISLTIGAPFLPVTFRDGFIGDILTSSVRPMQDLAFTTFYFLSGLQGWWSESYSFDAADVPLETNWLLHTMIIPMCTASPLWWRFLQNLRQCYDAKKRWPYLGNALKYFIAAEVAMFGVFNPSRKESFLWLSCFVAATLYQIWWDVFMDWELFVFEKGSVKLRRTRIYQQPWIYWTIFVINFFLRFCWTLSFLPPHYLNRAGVLSDTFEGDLTAILDPTIASAEIIRRTLWGLLRVELEAIKTARKEPHLKGAWVDEQRQLKVKTSSTQSSIHDDDDFEESVNEVRLLGELSIYATIFTGLGMLAAAHRMTF
ncbi:unnamed protein product [Cylindrotheca closterium]|uniref:EXS domain-containing protein n=1 Tax=Cylindrotheca closterium TaxID=2856 RepID=A0AAD2CUM5_9STRA|nr:unnamed protein product [Cylindrotheca closterium]